MNQGTFNVPVFREGQGLAQRASKVAVSNLVATTHPDGGRIDLSWINPPNTTYVSVSRGRRGFPWNEDDNNAEKLYINSSGSAATTTSYSDLNASEPGYYYYLVTARVAGGVGDIELSSYVFQLSIQKQLNTKEMLWKSIPEHYKTEDIDQNDLLRKYVEALGAGFDLVRGRINAMIYMNEAETSPIHMLVNQIASLGWAPEFSFDWAISRNIFGELLGLYKVKGTGEGLLRFIKLFTGWDATIADTVSTKAFRTWDGFSPVAKKLWDESRDPTLRGTAADPYFYLYGGRRAYLKGFFGIGDIHAYIAPGVTVHTGVNTAVGITTFTDATANFGANNSLVNMWLNPNRNQHRMFRIIGNTATTITLDKDISGFTFTGMPYFILRDRDRIKYQRLIERAKDFMPYGTRLFVFFQ